MSIYDNDSINIDNQSQQLISPSNDPRLSCCIVWTQIPMLTWIIPLFGHVGICDSHGCVHDFQGTYYVGKGNMLFGDPSQKWVIPIDPATLDNAINEVANQFKGVPYDILCSNCHFFVASVLDHANFRPLCCFKNWSTGATIKIAWGIFLKGRSISICRFLSTWIPFLIFYGIIILIIVLIVKL
ncbi:hypothetical protein M9Y10_034048 [Tritrichomonas musculus]|uniref:Transmembrane protein n=1 Tax=Tritrichomonas musculus TaxID=1915356 RepID=A0ABR2KEI5_9EUKA